MRRLALLGWLLAVFVVTPAAQARTSGGEGSGEGSSSPPLTVHAEVTTSVTLEAGKFTPVNATSGALTEKLPTGAAEGTEIEASKIDSSANEVTLEGSIEGTSGATIKLKFKREARRFVAGASGTWWPASTYYSLGSLEEYFPTKTVLATELASYAKLSSGKIEEAVLPTCVERGRTKSLGKITAATEALNLEEGEVFTGELESSSKVKFTIEHAPTACSFPVTLKLKNTSTGKNEAEVENLEEGPEGLSYPTTAGKVNIRSFIVQEGGGATKVWGIGAKEGKEGPQGKEGPKGETGKEGPKGTTLKWAGAWSSSTTYKVEEAVHYEGSSYVAIKEGSNKKPNTETTYWEPLAEKGEKGSGGESELTWHEMESLNKVESYEASYGGKLSCALASNGLVYWSGVLRVHEEITTGTERIFTVPSECRPEKVQLVTIGNAEKQTTIRMLKVETNGEVKLFAEGMKTSVYGPLNDIFYRKKG